METLNQIIENLAGKVGSLNYDYLTEKELDRSQKFLEDLSRKEKYMEIKQIYIDHPDLAIKNCSGLINGLKSYIDSLQIKIKQRENIPNWYIQNKLRC